VKSSEDKIAWIHEIHVEQYGIILAACDRDLLGKTLRRDDIEIVISERFYGGELVDEDELKRRLLQADVLNLIGKRVIQLAEKLGLIHPDSKIFFEDENGEQIPHAQMYRFMIR